MTCYVTQFFLTSLYQSFISTSAVLISHRPSAGFWDTGGSLLWSVDLWMLWRRLKMSLQTASWPKPSLSPPVLPPKLLMYWMVLKPWLWIDNNLQTVMSSLMSFFDLSPLHHLLCAPLSPSSGQRVLLWTVFLLLFHWACYLRPTQGPGGLLGCYAAGAVSGHS